MREFTTAIAQEIEETAGAEEGDITFLHDGREVTFHEPDVAQYSILAATISAGSDREAASTVINLFFSLLDESSARYFRGRLLNRNDTFTLTGQGGVQDILEGLIEEWSARPPTSPSDSSQSQPSTGQRSTAPVRRKASTRSTSAS